MGSSVVRNSYTYDDATPGHYGIGRLAGYADESGTTAYRYDARGNIVREDRTIGTQAYVSEYGWNADGLLIRKTYPSGRIVDYARNTRGQVTSVSTRANAGAPAVTVATAIAYEPFGPVKALTHGNGVTVALAYDLNGRLSAMDAFNGATPVLDLDYTYDLAGNITDIDDSGHGGNRGRDYAYDPLHRLTQREGAGAGRARVSPCRRTTPTTRWATVRHARWAARWRPTATTPRRTGWPRCWRAG